MILNGPKATKMDILRKFCILSLCIKPVENDDNKRCTVQITVGKATSSEVSLHSIQSWIPWAKFHLKQLGHDTWEKHHYHVQSYLSIADILYSGHLAIADRIFWSRQNPYKFLIKKPLYSGHGYSGHLVIADKIFHHFDQLYLFIADTEKNWISINHKINPKPHFDPIFQHSPSHTIPTTPLYALCSTHMHTCE